MPGRFRAVPSLYTSTGRRKYLTPDERRRFMDAARRCSRVELQTFCLTLALTGCRISECLALQAHAVNPDFIAFRSLKKRGGQVVIREVPIPSELFVALDSAHHLSELDDGTRLWRWSRCHAWFLVKEIMRDAGILAGVHATPKGLRHALGVAAIQRGVPIHLIQRWLGHASLEMTCVYLQAVGAEERDIARRLWEH